MVLAEPSARLRLRRRGLGDNLAMKRDYWFVAKVLQFPADNLIPAVAIEARYVNWKRQQHPGLTPVQLIELIKRDLRHKLHGRLHRKHRSNHKRCIKLEHKFADQHCGHGIGIDDSRHPIRQQPNSGQLERRIERFERRYIDIEFGISESDQCFGGQLGQHLRLNLGNFIHDQRSIRAIHHFFLHHERARQYRRLELELFHHLDQFAGQHHQHHGLKSIPND